MVTQFTKIEDEASWLAKKKGYVSSTEVAALFGLSPYQTAFELWHIKHGNISGDIDQNNFMRFGKIIEAPICDMIALENPNWIISQFPFFAHDDEDKIGSSFDRTVMIGNKNYLLEIKSISYQQYKKDFIEHSSHDIEASPHYEIQMQNEMELAKDYLKPPFEFAGIVMAIFILDTRSLKYIFRQRDPEMGAALRSAVKEFWDMTEPPAPDFARDKDTIFKLAPSVDPNKSLDATENQRVTELMAQIKASGELIKQEETAASTAKAELMTLIGNAKYVWTNYHKLSIADIVPNAGTEVTQEMVGTRIGAKAGYKRMSITATTAKE